MDVTHLVEFTFPNFRILCSTKSAPSVITLFYYMNFYQHNPDICQDCVDNIDPLLLLKWTNL